MADLVACVIALETEMMILRQVIDHLNGHIATLLSTIRYLRQAITSLQDVAFEAKNDELDLEFGGKEETDGTVEDSDGNPNASDDRSNITNDASDGAYSGDGCDGGDEVGDDVEATSSPTPPESSASIGDVPETPWVSVLTTTAEEAMTSATTEGGDGNGNSDGGSDTMDESPLCTEARVDANKCFVGTGAQSGDGMEERASEAQVDGSGGGDEERVPERTVVEEARLALRGWGAFGEPIYVPLLHSVEPSLLKAYRLMRPTCDEMLVLRDCSQHLFE
ncbi:hypothetical protein RHMOL_Rhmol01G0186700 [Rhododendron molle]|uniref:Uncharacterized protein n=1 Tax=Rhododendron molle TaxID=49168 RepID=A0ACC0Q2U9_RHOML|nr:hypothetical protein RHMOL_Rhmol01G0186700 [Rhododendron molle]